MSQPFRIPPALPVHQMKSYRIVVPRATHWRPATCAESDCQAYLLGWLTTVDEGTDLGRGRRITSAASPAAATARNGTGRG